MPSTQGKIEEIEKVNSNGNKFRVVTIDGTEYYLHDNDLFNSVEEGKEVGIEFTSNEKGDKVYRNINEISNVQTSSSEESSGTASWQKKARALELGIMYKDKIGTDDSVSEMAELFLDFMED